jgi:hypothetical protein
LKTVYFKASLRTPRLVITSNRPLAIFSSQNFGSTAMKTIFSLVLIFSFHGCSS